MIERVDRLCLEEIDDRALRIALVDELRRVANFNWYAWLVTDPATEVGGSPLADVPSVAELPRLIRHKYVTALNRWTTLDAGVATLHTASDGCLQRSTMWRAVLCHHGVSDVASLVFRDAHGCWGWLDLWRTKPEQPFDDREISMLSGVVGSITAALRRAQARTFTGVSPAPHRGPAVLVLSPDLTVKAQTAETEEYLRTLVPPEGDRLPVPAGAYNVAAQLLAIEAGLDEHPPSARVHLGGGVWVTLRAARAGDAESHHASDHHVGSDCVSDHDIAVTIERTSPAERRDLFARTHALSPRERELVEHLARGADTHTSARAMFLSEHTVQDHVKSIFTKTDTHSRRALVIRLTGA